MNIISNAIDALETEREGQLNPEPKIWIHTDILDNHDVVIQIRDNGSGMTPSVVERLFEPFFTTKPVGKGTGLGLSISHQIIVEKHGGTITCNSEVGVGTEFAIALPIQQQSQGNWGLGTEEAERVNNEQENFSFKVLSYEY